MRIGSYRKINAAFGNIVYRILFHVCKNIPGMLRTTAEDIFLNFRYAGASAFEEKHRCMHMRLSLAVLGTTLTKTIIHVYLGAQLIVNKVGETARSGNHCNLKATEKSAPRLWTYSWVSLLTLTMF